MSLLGIQLRSRVVHTVREILLERGFEEYLPQLMNEVQPLEPTIHSFKTQWNRNLLEKKSNTTQYFATSPEGYLKQVMASGSKNCFAISHAFRNLEGEGLIHRPEFLMAEWYKKGANWIDMINQTQQLVMAVWDKCDPLHQLPSEKWETVSLRELWQHHLQCDLETLLTDEQMVRFGKEKGYQTVGATWEQLFYQIVFNHLEPHYSNDPFFLIDFPTRISPLAKPQLAAPEFTERFELIINHIELANGNTENTNISTIETMMKQEQQLRQNQGESFPLDTTFITSLSRLQGNEWAGVGLGIDRLTMMVGGIPNIRDVQWI